MNFSTEERKENDLIIKGLLLWFIFEGQPINNINLFFFIYFQVLNRDA